MLKNVVIASLPLFALSVPAFGADTVITTKKDGETKEVYEIGQEGSFVLTFPAGESELTAAHKAQIQAALKKNPIAVDRLREVVVATYADQGYPAAHKESLNSNQRNLAAERGKKVKDQLEKDGAKKVKVYNMAEKANWFEKTFKTKDAQIKREAAVDAKHLDAEEAFYQIIGNHLTEVGGPSKVVVTVVYQLDKLSH